MPGQYKYIEIEIKDHLAYVRLKSSNENTLTIPAMREITMAHNSLTSENDISGIILSAQKPGFFCNGLDIEILLAADNKGKKEIFGALYDMSHAVYAYPKPHISLINGHAMAGGAVLASLSDFRFMSGSTYRIGFTEVKLGITLPPVFINILRAIIPPQHIGEVILLGKALKGPEALETGLITGIFNEDEDIRKTEKFMKEIQRYTIQGYIAIKFELRKDINRQFRENREACLDSISQFFNETLNESLLAVKEKRRPHI